jgi:hypothetical protein
MKQFSINNVSQVLTAKERAKMVANLLIEQDETKVDRKGEVESIKAGIPDAQVSEYNFYMDLIYSLQVGLDLDLQTLYYQLTLCAAQLQGVYRILHMGIVADILLFQLRWFPTVMTENQFQKLYQDLRQEQLAAVFSVDTLAEHEALIIFRKQEKYKDWDSYQMECATQEETFEDKELWLTTLQAQKDKIEHAIVDGSLVEATVTTNDGYYNTDSDVGKRGITASSWYQYQEKENQDFNSYIDEARHLVHFHKNAVAIDYSPFVDDEEDHDRNKQRIMEIVEQMAVIKRKYTDKYDALYLTVDPSLVEQIRDIAITTSVIYARVRVYMDITVQIENTYFDGQEVVSRKLWSGTKAKDAYEQIELAYQEMIKEILEYFGKMFSEKVSFESPEITNIFEQSAGEYQKIFDETMDSLIESAKKKSGFRPRYLPS